LLPSLRLADELGLIRDMINILYDIALTEAALGDQVSAIRLLAAVRQHPYSNQTRSFSFWLGERESRLRDLAEARLGEMAAQMSPNTFAAALQESQTLPLDIHVRELLKSDY
jgi:hypothetical protein